jgi:hypothetical protein
MHRTTVPCRLCRLSGQEAAGLLQMQRNCAELRSHYDETLVYLGAFRHLLKDVTVLTFDELFSWLE